MLSEGIVAVGDICNNTLTLPQKAKGRIYYHNFIEASGFNPQMAEQRFERVVDIFNEYAKQYSMPVESSILLYPMRLIRFLKNYGKRSFIFPAIN